jgi:hypothetical protein
VRTGTVSKKQDIAVLNAGASQLTICARLKAATPDLRADFWHLGPGRCDLKPTARAGDEAYCTFVSSGLDVLFIADRVYAKDPWVAELESLLKDPSQA